MRHSPLLLPVIFSLLVAHSIANCEKDKNDGFYNSIFGVTDKAILAPAVENNPEGKEALRTMLNYYKYLENNLTRVPATKDDLDSLSIGNIPRFVSFYGWPAFSDKVQRLYLPVKPVEPANRRRRTEAELQDALRYKKEKKQFKVSEGLVFKALEDFGEALDTSKGAMKRILGWPQVFHNSRLNYTTESKTHRCKIRSNLGYRVDGKWVVGAGITNERIAITLRNRKRLFVGEQLYLDASDVVRAFPFHLNMTVRCKYDPKEYWNSSSPISPNLTTVTTTLGVFNGAAGITFFRGAPIEENIAMVAALGNSHILTRQALDSKSASNSAILVFPIFMAAVPIALFADVSGSVTFGYMLFTDVITVLPLGIKGVELLYAGLKEFFSTRSVVYGDLSKNGTVAVATSSARCESAQNLTEYGIAFVVVAIVAMVLGISLEFLARAEVEKHKRAAKERDLHGVPGVEYLWQRTGLCVQCDCREKRRVAVPEASQSSIGGGLISHLQQRRKEASERAEGSLFSG